MSKLSALHDLLTDVSIELRSRMARTILLVTAVALSVGALISSVGISKNAAHQIDADLAASTINLISVQAAEATRANGEGSEAAASQESSVTTQLFPDDAEQRVLSLGLVESVGMYNDLTVTISSPVVGRGFTEEIENKPRLVAVSSGLLEVDGARVTGPGAWMLDSTMNVVMLGEDAAKMLGIPVTDHPEGLSVDVNHVNYSVVGFFASDGEINRAIAFPYRVGVAMAGNDLQTEVRVKTKIGAGTQVAGVVRHAILPQSPEKLSASQVISAERARSSVSTQMSRQAAWVGLFLIVLTILFITNSMIVAVTARTTEIGLRRALGSSRTAVSAVFWVEGGLTGVLGRLGGSAVSAWVIVLVAWLSGWSAHIDPLWIMLGPVLGAFVGLIASAYPALRASAVHPAIAVRSN